MEYIKQCPKCQLQGRKQLQERLNPIPVTSKPFERVGIDVKHVSTSRLGSKYIVVAIDYLTKYVEARALQFLTSSDIALFLYERVICLHGTPVFIHTDNGRPMISELMRQVCKQFNINHKTITPYNSQSQGLVEWFNRVIDQVLQRLNPEQKKDWDHYLEATLFAYRSIKQETTKHSPFFLLYGYEPNVPFDNTHRLFDSKSTSFEYKLTIRLSQQILYLKRIREQVTQYIAKSQKNQIKRIDKVLLETKKELKPAFKIGDQVLLYKDYRSTSWSGKIETTWDGIFVIHIVLGKGTYYIKNLSNPEDTKLRRVHGNRMKKYSEPQV